MASPATLCRASPLQASPRMFSALLADLVEKQARVELAVVTESELADDLLAALFREAAPEACPPWPCRRFCDPFDAAPLDDGRLDSLPSPATIQRRLHWLWHSHVHSDGRRSLMSKSDKSLQSNITSNKSYTPLTPSGTGLGQGSAQPLAPRETGQNSPPPPPPPSKND